MTKDPIVEEVRAVRDEIARENHYDLDIDKSNHLRSPANS
jgi:hypothetical protein